MTLEDIVTFLSGLGTGVLTTVLTANPLYGILAGSAVSGLVRGYIDEMHGNPGSSFLSKLGKGALAGGGIGGLLGALVVPTAAVAETAGALSVGGLGSAILSGAVTGGIYGLVAGGLGALVYAGSYGLTRKAANWIYDSGSHSTIAAAAIGAAAGILTSAVTYNPFIGIPVGIAAFGASKGLFDGIREPGGYGFGSTLKTIGKYTALGVLGGAVIGGLFAPALYPAIAATFSTAAGYSGLGLAGLGAAWGGLSSVIPSLVVSSNYGLPYGLARASSSNI